MSNVSIRHKAKVYMVTGRVDVRIGKRGIHSNVVKEIMRILDRKGIVKVRFLKSAVQDRDFDDVLSELMKKISMQNKLIKIADVRGRVVVLYKERKKSH